jgi:hypothetical protein
MITRRSFLVAAVAAGGVAAGWRYAYLPGLSGLHLGAQDYLFFDGGPGARLIQFIASNKAFGPLGSAWLASLEYEPEMTDLLRSLASRIDLDSADLDAAIAQQVLREFAGGGICIIDGWQLSLTECQLGGLQTLAIASGLIDGKGVQRQASAEGMQAYTVGEIAPLESWGPRHTLQGKKFNQQLDGHSGLWFKVLGAPAHVKIMIDGEIVKTSVSERTVSSGLFDEMQERILSTPGQYDIDLVDPIRKIRQPVGKFEVRADPSASKSADERTVAFCQIEKWGPRTTTAGVAANEQPDGSMGIWVRTPCLPDNTQLFFGEDLLPAKRRPFGLTASIPLAFLGAPGSVALTLYNPQTTEKLLIGQLVIE